MRAALLVLAALALCACEPLPQDSHEGAVGALPLVGAESAQGEAGAALIAPANAPVGAVEVKR